MSKSSGFQTLSKDSGYRCIAGFLSELTAEVDVDLIFIKIKSLIENMDISLLSPTIKNILETLSKQGLPDIQKQQLLYCVNKLIEYFVNFPQFHSTISALFSTAKSIPTAISMLDLTTALSILVFTDSTPIFGDAKAFISKNIIPKLAPEAYEKLPEVVLFELSNLFLPEFSIPEIMTPNIPPSLSLLSETVPYDNKLSLALSNPSLYDAVVESEPRSLIAKVPLDRLFGFFPDFNESHAASYLTAISSSACSFRPYFDTLEDMQKERVVKVTMEAFVSRGVDLSSIVNYLDQPNLKPLDKDGCAMLFSTVSSISQNQKIDAYPFVIPWSNTRSQLEYLMYIATMPTNITFGSKCRMIPQEILTNIKYDISPIPNGCWICIDFVERFLELASIYPKEVNPFYQASVQKFGHVILFALSQAKEQQTKEYIDFINYIFNIVLYSQLGSRDYFEELWKYSPKFCVRAIFLFAKSSPQKLTKIAETFTAHLKELLDSDNLEFSIDLAFNVTIKDSINIDEFIDSLVAKHGQEILVTFLQLVKSRALESQPTSMQVFITTLNAIFKWLSNHFKTLNPGTQLIANALYSICENIGNGLQKFNFAESLPPVNPPDLKHASSEYFTNYFDSKTTLNDFLLILHHVKVVNNQLFDAMIHYPIYELNYLSNYDTKFTSKLGQLVGNMVLENLFGESELNSIFQAFHKTYSEESDQSIMVFTSTALNICYFKLTRIPIYAFNLLKQPQFKQKEPILYQNLKKISMSLSAPIQLSQSTKLNIHPKIRRFEKLQQPPPRLRKVLQQLNTDNTQLSQTIQSFSGFVDWLALHLVEDIEDHPALLQDFLPQFLENREFTEIIIRAASFEVYNLVEKSNDIATYEGGFKRRRLSILGRLIGNLTFALNRPLLSKYIDIKRLLLYALAHGKLFGVLPFVGAILRCATPFFNPPNPYMSAILQVLASINSIDLLKLSIKNQISLIMSHFEVTSSQFMVIPLIPNINETNFDFITAPFSLLYVSSQTEIDKIISFEDSAFYTLASQHFIVPDYEGENAEEKQSKFRSALTQATLAFLKTEGKSLSLVVSSTASELIMKDFVLCNNMSLIYQTAETLTKQLSASLAMFTVFQKQQIYLHHNVLHELSQEDSDWALQGVQANQNWIGQLLKDVVYLKAWKIVQQKLEVFEQQKKENTHSHRHQDPIPQKIQHLIPPSILPTEQGLLPQHNLIYQDLAELALNPAQIAVFDKPGEKVNKSFEQYETFFQWVSKRIASETELNEQINSLLQLIYDKIPDVGPNFESFMCLIRTMMKYMYKNNHKINDIVFSKILEKVVSDAQPGYIVRMQPLIVSWLRNFIPSVSLLCEFLKTELLTTKLLDRFFFDNLNRQPLNGKLFLFAVRFLHQTLVEKPTLKPGDMIDSISFVVTTPYSLIESVTTSPQNYTIDELQKVLDNMDVPLNVLSTNSKLQSVSIFDPFEDLQDLDKIQANFTEWKEIAENVTILTNSDRSEIIEKTLECIEFGKSFFIYLFFSETEEIITKFLMVIFHSNNLENCFLVILEALEVLIQGNSHVISFDFRKYYDIIIRLITHSSNTSKLLNIASLLHNLRLLCAPTFTPCWTQLITHNHFVSFLVKHAPEVMKLLLEDYTYSITYLQGAHAKETFDIYYRSLLRFVLIMVHDFPDFMDSISLEICSMFGSHFTQLRNIFLSVTNNILPPITNDPFKFDTFVSLNQPMPELTKELAFDEIDDEESIKKFVSQLEKRSGTTALASYVVYLINKSECKDIQQKLEKLIEFTSPETTINILHVCFDQLRYQGRVTSVFIKFLVSLMKKPKLDELIVTIALERYSTPAPQPWGIRCFVMYLVTDKEIDLENRKFVSDSPEVQTFIKAIKASVVQQSQ